MSNPSVEMWKNDHKREEEKRAFAEMVVVVDRSASMVSMQTGVVDGFNEYVRKIHGTPGDNRWTMVHFDDHASAEGAKESFPHVVFEGKEEKELPFLSLASQEDRSGGLSVARAWGIQATEEMPQPIPSGSSFVSYNPRGGTALVDAIYKIIDQTKARISGNEDYRKVVMMIITDGEENSSRFHSTPEMRQKIAETIANGWEYLYLGANQDAFAVAQGMGLQGQNAVRCAGLAPNATYGNNFVPTNAGIREAIASGAVGMFSIASGSIASGQISPRYMGAS